MNTCCILPRGNGDHRAGQHSEKSDYMLQFEELRFDSRQYQDMFLYSKTSTPALKRNLLPIQWLPKALSAWSSRPRLEADHAAASVPMSRTSGFYYCFVTLLCFYGEELSVSTSPNPSWRTTHYLLSPIRAMPW